MGVELGCEFKGKYDLELNMYKKEKATASISFYGPKNEDGAKIGTRYTIADGYTRLKNLDGASWFDITGASTEDDPNNMICFCVSKFKNNNTKEEGFTISLMGTGGVSRQTYIRNYYDNNASQSRGFYATENKKDYAGALIIENYRALGAETQLVDNKFSTTGNLIDFPFIFTANCPILLCPSQNQYYAKDGTKKSSNLGIPLDDIDRDYILNYGDDSSLERYIETSYVEYWRDHLGNLAGGDVNSSSSKWVELAPTTSYLVEVDNVPFSYELVGGSSTKIDVQTTGLTGEYYDTDFDSIPKEYIGQKTIKFLDRTVQPTKWRTNIPIFKNREDGEKYVEALESGDEDAINEALEKSENIDPGVIEDDEVVTIGNPVGKTELNEGYSRSIFQKMFALTQANMYDIANIIFTKDTSVENALTNGLKLYGANPMDFIGSLLYFPFDVSKYATFTLQSNMNFGSYNAVVNDVAYIPSGRIIIDCGAIPFPQQVGDYTDYEPYSEMYITLPYIGTYKVPISNYYSKLIGIKYVVDLYTGAAKALIFANGTMVDSYGGNIGFNMPITGNNFAQYSQNVCNSITGMIKSAVGVTGAITGGGMSVLGAVSGMQALGASELQANNSLNQNYVTSKGSPSASIDLCLPQYPLIQVFKKALLTPKNETAVVGKPSSYGGKLSGLKGYVKCKKISLKSDAPSNIVKKAYELLASGIYIN